MPSVDRDPITVEARQRIAAEIRAEMARQNKSQRDIADALRLPQQALQIRLAGKRSFRAEELADLAVALGVPVAQFLPTPREAAA